MRFLIALPLIALACWATDARAFTVDAKAMARFDASYFECEARYPEMRGHRDEAYLSLWRIKADAPARAQLASVRKGSVYLAQKQRVAAAAAKGGASAGASTFDHECQALWAETQRTLQTKK